MLINPVSSARGPSFRAQPVADPLEPDQARALDQRGVARLEGLGRGASAVRVGHPRVGRVVLGEVARRRSIGPIPGARAPASLW